MTARAVLPAPESPWRVPYDGSFAIAKAATSPPSGAPRAKKSELKHTVDRISDAQRVLYADDRYGLLLIFQAMDAAGKDGTIRAVFSGVNPAGCHVTSFRQPSALELDHDFLWRTTRELPARGTIGIFNRSYYEEVLIVRVRPEILAAQRLPGRLKGPRLFAERFRSIRDHEQHLARNGFVVLKFFLNVSREEQQRRFIARLEDPRKHWKFSARDVAEAESWSDYMAAYEDALNATARPWAPWYAIPADDKHFMRQQVANVVAAALDGLGLDYPEPSPEREAECESLRAALRRRAKPAGRGGARAGAGTRRAAPAKS